MPTVDGLGGVFNLIQSSSGTAINMKHCEAVTWISSLGAGTQTLTLTQSIAGASEQNLAVIETIWAIPSVGGTWTEYTQSASHTYTHADGTNNAIAYTLYADQLADTYTHAEMTVSGGICIALIHDLRHPRAASNLVDMTT